MQSTERFRAANSVSFGCGLQATAEQWLFVLPMTLALAAVVVRRLARLAQPREQFLFWAFAPMATFFFLLGWTPSWHVLWSLPAYLALTVAMAGALAEQPDAVSRFYRAHWAWPVGLGTLGVVVLVLHGVFVLPGVPPLRETYGWDRAAELSRSLRTTLPEGSFYVTACGRPYTSTSELAFHLGTPFQVFGQNLIGEEALQYRFWADPQKLAGKDAVIVIEGPLSENDARAALLPHFQTIEPAAWLTVPLGKLEFWSNRRVQFSLYVAHGYQPALGQFGEK